MRSGRDAGTRRSLGQNCHHQIAIVRRDRSGLVQLNQENDTEPN